MGLIKCPECGSKISTRARMCSYCGFESDDSTRAISLQDQYEVIPLFQYEVEEWNPVGEPLSLISSEDNKMLFNLLGKWDNLQLRLPAVADLIQKLKDKETMLVADMDSYLKDLIDKGIYKIAVDKNGEILPQLKEGATIRKLIRLKEVELTPDVTQTLNNLSTNAGMVRILDEIEYVGNEIKNIQLEMQDDRLAIIDGSRDKLKQAKQIQDTRLRELAILNVVNSATDGKRVLMKNFKRNLEYLKSHQDDTMVTNIFSSNANRGCNEKAVNSFQALVSITNAIQLECEGYTILGEYEASKVCLSQFRNFVIENKLDQRDTLLLLNENLKEKQTCVVDEFSVIVDRIAKIDDLNYIDSSFKSLNRTEPGGYSEEVFE